MLYTIVLTPPEEQAIKYVEASQTYKNYQPKYLLTQDGTSSPHITVVQFECETRDLANQVWTEMCERMKNENFTPFNPPFTGVAFINGVGPYENTTWVELSVMRGDTDSPIMKVHNAAVDVLKKSGFKPLNACENNYRPHLTLARIVMPENEIITWRKDLCDNPGAFQLKFGLPDGEWQYAQTLEIFP